VGEFMFGGMSGSVIERGRACRFLSRASLVPISLLPLLILMCSVLHEDLVDRIVVAAILIRLLRAFLLLRRQGTWL